MRIGYGKISKRNVDGVKLDGDAVASEAVVGKTFFSNDALSKLTGTGTNAKRVATGTISSFSIAGTTGETKVVSGIGFTPNVIFVYTTDGAFARYDSASMNTAEDWAKSPDVKFTNISAVGSGTFTVHYYNYNSSSRTIPDTNWIALE